MAVRRAARGGYDGQAFTRERATWLKRRSMRFNILICLCIAAVCLSFALAVVKFINVYSLDNTINTTRLEMRSIEAKIENLASEMALETRADVVRRKAETQLNMVLPAENEAFAVVLVRSVEIEDDAKKAALIDNFSY